jgi:hypothetical protein
LGSCFVGFEDLPAFKSFSKSMLFLRDPLSHAFSLMKPKASYFCKKKPFEWVAQKPFDLSLFKL